MSISAKKLAEILEVSPSTISMVYNGRRGISQETVKLVREGAMQYGYVHHNARSIEQNVTKKYITYLMYKRDCSIIGDTIFFTSMLQNIELAASSAGFTVVIQYFYESQNVEEQLNVIHRSGTSGIIILATEMDSEKVSIFKALNIPIVVLDNNAYNIDIDNVCINNMQGAYAAVSYLILKGHRDIGYIGVSSRINNFDVRFMGANQAMRTLIKRPYTTDTRIEVRLGLEEIYHDMLSYIQKKRGRRLPTAFFVENDFIAAECIRAFQASGYRIPEDISIIGFDDTLIAELTEPRLTTMRVNQEEMARIAVVRLKEQIEHTTRSSQLIAISAELVVRDSVAAPRERS